MCEGFGGVYTFDGRFLWTEPNIVGDCSHTTTLDRAKIRENYDPFIRYFVRWQFRDWTPESFQFDEEKTLPAWVDVEEVKREAIELLKRVLPVYEKQKQDYEQQNLRLRYDCLWKKYQEKIQKYQKQLNTDDGAEFLLKLSVTITKYHEDVQEINKNFLDPMKLFYQNLPGYVKE